MCRWNTEQGCTHKPCTFIPAGIVNGNMFDACKNCGSLISGSEGIVKYLERAKRANATVTIYPYGQEIIDRLTPVPAVAG